MRLVLAAVAVASLPVLSACTPAPAPVAPAPVAAAPAQVTEQEQALLATVEGVDMSSRILTLRRPDGIMEKVYAPADVTNLPQVRIGDQIIVSYVAVISAERATATDAPTAVVDKAIMRTPQGSKPGVAIGSSATTTVTVESYDPQTHTVTFTGPNGVTQTAELQRSQMQDLAATLKKGDQVQVTFSEAASLTIQRPAN